VDQRRQIAPDNCVMVLSPQSSPLSGRKLQPCQTSGQSETTRTSVPKPVLLQMEGRRLSAKGHGPPSARPAPTNTLSKAGPMVRPWAAQCSLACRRRRLSPRQYNTNTTTGQSQRATNGPLGQATTEQDYTVLTIDSYSCVKCSLKAPLSAATTLSMHLACF
jgi:hypothetical protein